MSGIKTVALAGAGSIGSYIADELLKAKASGALDGVIILTRASSSNAAISQYAARGATIAEVDYSSPATLERAVAGAQAVVSTVGGSALGDESQLTLARAAHAAGVRLFVPSDFGNNNDGKAADNDILAAKAKLYAKLEEIGLEWATFYTGLFSDFVFIPFVGFDFSNGKATVGGDGNAPVSFTHRTDIARFVVHALTTFPREYLHNKVIRIEGSRKSFNEIGKIYEKKHGTKIEFTYTPIEELKAQVEKDPYAIIALLHLEWAHGRGAVGKTLDNDKWPEWNPIPVEDVL